MIEETYRDIELVVYKINEYTDLDFFTLLPDRQRISESFYIEQVVDKNKTLYVLDCLKYADRPILEYILFVVDEYGEKEFWNFESIPMDDNELYDLYMWIFTDDIFDYFKELKRNGKSS